MWDPDLSPSLVLCTSVCFASGHPSGLAFCTQPREEVLTNSLDLADYTSFHGMIYL